MELDVDCVVHDTITLAASHQSGLRLLRRCLNEMLRTRLRDLCNSWRYKAVRHSVSRTGLASLMESRTEQFQMEKQLLQLQAERCRLQSSNALRRSRRVLLWLLCRSHNRCYRAVLCR